jgi:hypothetical protein
MITQAELRKMLKEHNVDISMLSRLELILYITEINTKFDNLLEAEGLEFEGFIEFIKQLSVFFFQKRFNVHKSEAEL